MEWMPMSVNQFCTEEEHRASLPHEINQIADISSLHIVEPANLLTSTFFDWGGDKEPIDIDRNMADVTLVEVS
jgi:hypothetical protein